MPLNRAILILLAAVALGAGEVRLVAAFADGPRCGDLLTWRIEGAPAAWLVADVQATPRLTISGPDGRTLTRRAYLDQEHRAGAEGGAEFTPVGEPFLAVRHTVREPGRHTVTLWSPDGKAVASASLDLAPAAGPIGPIRISPDNPRILSWADGTPWIAIGPNLAWASAPDRAADFARYCALLKAQGCTHLRVWLASWSGKPWGDAPGELRLGHAWLMDRQLAAARANGLAVTLVLENFHDIQTGRASPWGATAEARLAALVDAGPPEAWKTAVRYALARWGADDAIAMLEPMNEIDMLQPVRERALPWLERTLAWLKREDQDRRLLTASWAGDDWPRAMALPDCDVAQIRGYVFEWTDADWRLQERTRDAIGMWLEPFAEAQRLGKPFLLAEVGYQGTNEVNRGNDLDADGLLLRQLAWAGLMLGGAGSGMNWWWDVYIDRRGLWGVYGPLARTAAAIDWRDKELAPLTPNRGGPMRVLGWVSPRQAALWPVHTLDTWYAAVAQGRRRPTPIQPVTAVLAGFAKDAAYRVQPVSLLDGAARPAWTQRSTREGRFELVVPPGTIDTVYLLKREAP
jgi:hypothetical protein